ncbi:general secretion pathway protein GspK [Pseudoxanthomonas spadix]|uniref:general secretion pathway protein GspK n=1 Tax=Pseudoxanthomonas spadix TaxID=415229 RepID=UPI000EFED6B0|nr:type II secretion system protein GspK [Pseudoxanthomonas spadix]MBP3973962.1 general secretion pathway protein GspK [Pseudoxanthomonas spadix]RMW95135.1 general secretion pathway protein GspK [Pseudoxanthomonas spadix]
MSRAGLVAPGAQRGVALLLVVWLIALLTALIGAFAISARVESLQGRVLAQGSVVQQIARAGLEYALQRVADPDPGSRWTPDGRPYAWQYAGSQVQVQLVDESGKVDLNQADAQILSSLLRAVGVEAGQAQQLAGAAVDWRDSDALSQVAGGAEDPDYAAAGLPYGAKDAPYESVAEVEQVLGWTPQLYARVRAYLTIYAGRGRPDPRYAQAPVLTALGLDPGLVLAQRQGSIGQPALVGQGTGTYSIQSRARTPDGRQAVLRAVVRAGGGPTPGSMYTTLRWEEGWEPR